MLELLATACAGAFAGAALYISVVQHPAVLELGAPTASAFFPLMYRRAAPLQAGLAIVGSIAGACAWIAGAGALCLLGALLLGFVVPFTLLGIKPVNDRLLEPGLDPSAGDVPRLLRRWGILHGVRTASSGAAFLVFLSN
jgi:hypothetical protein